MPQTPYDTVLQAARRLPEVDSALAAEMLGATLLGSVYTLAERDRAAAVREFVGGFLTHTARRRTVAARAVRCVFAALVPDAAGAARVSSGTRAPQWATALGAVRLTGCWAYGDVYGDQTSYVAAFAYDDPAHGGGEHAVVALVDHNIGIVKDLFVSEPADRLVAEVRQGCAEDELTWFAEADAATLRARVEGYLAVTDALWTLPEGGSLATDRMLVGARLAQLPAPPSGAAPLPGPTATGPASPVAGLADERAGAGRALAETAGVDAVGGAAAGTDGASATESPVGESPAGEVPVDEAALDNATADRAAGEEEASTGDTPTGTAPATLVASFLESPYAAALDSYREKAESSMWYSLRLILDFVAEGPESDPLRWSPTVVGLFLLDWVHRRAVLDETDVAVLPAVVRAWAAWAAAERGLPAPAAVAVDEAVDVMAPEFTRLHRTGGAQR